MDSRINKFKDKINHFLFWTKTDKKTTKSPWSLKHEKAEQTIGKEANKAATNAKTAAELSKFNLTALGIAMLGHNNGFISLAPFGVPMTIGGIVIDSVKAPICLTIASEEAIRSGITKLASLLFEPSAEKQIEKRLFKSFLIRLQETATILVALGLEDADVLNQKLKSGDIEDLVGLTLLHTAYASRNYYNGLILASNKVLSEEDCPPHGRMLFDKIMEVKKTIRDALNLSTTSFKSNNEEQRELEQSRIVCQWIRDIKAGKIVTVSDKPEASLAELEVVNKIIAQIEELKNYGMGVLPEKPEKVASHLPKFG